MNVNKVFAIAVGVCLGVALIAVAYGNGPQTEDVAGGTVIGLRGYPIAAQTPKSGEVLTFGSNGVYAPAASGSGSSGISGLTSGQLGVAGSATTLTSSIAFGLTGNSTIVETTTGGLLTPSILPLATNAAIGGMRGDTTTITCTAGVCTAVGAAATAVTVGTTTVGSGTTLQFLYNNAGVLGNKTIACADLSDGATGCSTAIGTSGATIGLLNANKTDSGTNSFTGANNTFTAMAGVINTLTISTATFTPVLASGVNQAATLVHASCPCTIANPSDTSSHIGQTGVIVVTQSSTGSDAVGTWGSQFVTPGGVATISLSTAANAVDYVPYYVADSTHVVLGTVIKAPSH